MRSVFNSVFAVIAATGFLLPVRAAAPAVAVQSQPPVYKTQTREVVVDVVVTGKGGGPVGGLQTKDFVVMEDGKAQSIDYFEEHTARTLPDRLKPVAMPAGVYTNVPPAPEADSVNVVLLDALNTDREDQSHVRQQMLEFLKGMQPGMRVAVYVLGSRLRLVQGFTADSLVLRNAVVDKKYGVTTETDKSVTRSLQDKFQEIEEKQTLADMQMGPAGFASFVEWQANFAGYQADQRVAMTLEALGYLARNLAGVPGRKNLIWFSSSFPVTVFPSAKEKDGFGQIRGNGDALRKTADLLTLSKVAVYPIGAEGMMVNHNMDGLIQSNSAVDIEGGHVTTSLGAVPSGRPSDFTTSFANESAARSDKMMAMERLAADTGGKAFYNTNDLSAAMSRAISDGSRYYTLTYTPTNKKMDGSYRRIEIKSGRDGYRLAYRRGYNADGPLTLEAKSGGDPLRALMMPGVPDSTQILYAAHGAFGDSQAGAEGRAGNNKKLVGPTQRYGLDLLIHAADVRLEGNAEGRYVGNLRVELMAYDRMGTVVNWMRGTQVLDLTDAQLAEVRKGGIRAHFEMDLPVGRELLLETGVYDSGSGKAGTLEIPVHRASSSDHAGADISRPN